MDQRQRLINDQATYTPTELAERYGVSRKTVYKWLERFAREGPAGLLDRSHARHAMAHQTDAVIAEELLSLRRAHPHWGARTLRAVLARRDPQRRLPAASTIGALLKRHGLIQRRAKRSAAVAISYDEQLIANAANDVWCIDFKGEFRLGNRQYCYPLTVSDGYSRVVLECYGLASTAHAGTQRRLERLFRQYGLPRAIRSDNGVPFVSPGPLGLSRLSLWWAKLGIEHQRIRPAHPQQNGRHERMHRTLKAETTRPPSQTLAQQQRRFDAWRAEYNSERPHQGINFAVPSDLYQRSSRELPSSLPKPEYAGHCQVRRVAHNGSIRFQRVRVFISQVLAMEEVALEEIDEGVWNVLLYDLVLGRLDERDYRLH
jgi:transposase InsO family protein